MLAASFSLATDEPHQRRRALSRLGLAIAQQLFFDQAPQLGQLLGTHHRRLGLDDQHMRNLRIVRINLVALDIDEQRQVAVPMAVPGEIPETAHLKRPAQQFSIPQEAMLPAIE